MVFKRKKPQWRRNAIKLADLPFATRPIYTNSRESRKNESATKGDRKAAMERMHSFAKNMNLSEMRAELVVVHMQLESAYKENRELQRKVVVFGGSTNF